MNSETRPYDGYGTPTSHRRDRGAGHGGRRPMHPFLGRHVSVTTGSATVTGTSVDMTAGVESIGTYDDLDAYFRYCPAGAAAWQYVTASPGTVDAPTALTGVIEGLDDADTYEWSVSLSAGADPVATGAVRTVTPNEPRGPPSADGRGLATIQA